MIIIVILLAVVTGDVTGVTVLVMLPECFFKCCMLFLFIFTNNACETAVLSCWTVCLFVY